MDLSTYQTPAILRRCLRTQWRWRSRSVRACPSWRGSCSRKTCASGILPSWAAAPWALCGTESPPRSAYRSPSAPSFSSIKRTQIKQNYPGSQQPSAAAPVFRWMLHTTGSTLCWIPRRSSVAPVSHSVHSPSSGSFLLRPRFCLSLSPCLSPRPASPHSNCVSQDSASSHCYLVKKKHNSLFSYDHIIKIYLSMFKKMNSHKMLLVLQLRKNTFEVASIDKNQL